ncbi:unnamed protein product [Parnassius mnemosyne]|uniref:Transposable element P transposase-like RNase H domain-containing protein n=1 Tax=Parnassius mnemosyne TaxID=213953 RepID=A0AAV1KBN4_9NEOP
MRICDKHFTEKDRNRNNRLNALTVPSLFLHGSHADVPMQNEQSGSTNLMSEQSLGQPEVSANNQSTSDDVVDVQTQIKACFQISTMIEQSAGQPNNHQSALYQPSDVSFDPLVEHNYCKVSKEHHKIKSRKSNLPSVVTSEKYRVYQKNIKNLRRLIYRLGKQGKGIKSPLKNAEKLFNKSDFRKFVKDMKPAAKLFANMQYYQAQKKPTGRRFKIEEKILSLSLFKRSPKCYALMSIYFILPSTKSLKQLLAKIELGAAINEMVFKKLRKTINNFDTQDKLCTVIFDEMSITPQIQYDSSKDELKGFASHGKNQIANHALVFMIKGIRRQYKQPVAYYFTNSLNKFELKTIIKEVVNVQKSELVVLATVCDQSTVNVGAIEKLIKETKANYLRKGNNINNFYVVEPCCSYISSIVVARMGRLDRGRTTLSQNTSVK